MTGLYSNEYPPKTIEVAKKRIETLKNEISHISFQIDHVLLSKFPGYVSRSQSAISSKKEELVFLRSFIDQAPQNTRASPPSIVSQIVSYFTEPHKKAA